MDRLFFKRLCKNRAFWITIFILFFLLTNFLLQVVAKNGLNLNHSRKELKMIGNGEEVVRGNKNKKQIIFTFDGGGTTASADKILEVLKKHKVKGTFFMTGQMVKEHPDFIKKIVAEDYEIFNHSYNHPYLTEVSDEKIKEELQKMDGVLFSTAKVHSKPFFRPPFGDRDERVLRVAKSLGYQSIYWTVDAMDWQEWETDETVKKRILNSLDNGNIYLMHVGDKITGNILDEVFTEIEDRGYKIVSLTEGI